VLGYCLLVSVRLLFHTVWLTVTKKLEVSQELNVLPTAMPLSLNDFVASVMTYCIVLTCGIFT